MKLYHFVFMSLATMAICSCGDDNSESEKANANL